MPGLEFLRCLGEAALADGLPALRREIPFAEVAYQLAKGALARWQERRREKALKAEIEAIARQGVEAAREAAAQVAREVAAGKPKELEFELELYLSQVPAAVRRSLARSEDPTGTTLPAGVEIERPEQVVPLLPARMPRFRPGDRPDCLRGEWELVELLGSGGFGEVWKGRHVDSPAMVSAFKFCLDPGARDRLLRHEAAVLLQVQQHGKRPGVVWLEDFSLRGETAWLRYEFADGGDLLHAFAGLRPLPPAERAGSVVSMLRDLASVVGHFHRLNPAVVHRDLKPANILVSGGPGARALRVADFGIGNVVSRPTEAPSGSTPSMSGLLTLGGTYTALYASPQQRRGAPPDPRDDVYALGVLAYQLLVADPAAEIGPDFDDELTAQGVPAAVVRVVKDCVAHNADKRPKDGAELADRLAPLAPASDTGARAGEALPQPAPQTAAKPTREAARERLVRALFQLKSVKPISKESLEGVSAVLIATIVGIPLLIIPLALRVWSVRRARALKVLRIRAVAEEIEAARRSFPDLNVATPDENAPESLQRVAWDAVRRLEGAETGNVVRVTVRFPTSYRWVGWIQGGTWTGEFAVSVDDRLIGRADLYSGAELVFSAPAGMHLVQLVGEAHEQAFLIEIPAGEGAEVEIPANAFSRGSEVRVYRT